VIVSFYQSKFLWYWERHTLYLSLTIVRVHCLISTPVLHSDSHSLHISFCDTHSNSRPQSISHTHAHTHTLILSIYPSFTHTLSIYPSFIHALSFYAFLFFLYKNCLSHSISHPHALILYHILPYTIYRHNRIPFTLSTLSNTHKHTISIHSHILSLSIPYIQPSTFSEYFLTHFLSLSNLSPIHSYTHSLTLWLFKKGRALATFVSK